MRLIAISCVKNEEDIVEAFVRHTLSYVDQVVMLDNGSGDKTKEILYSLQTEGLSVDIIEDATIGHWHEKRMNFLMREYALTKYGADGIVPLDVDEIIVAEDLSTFRSTICTSTLPVKIGWRSYIPDPSDDSTEINPVLRIRFRLVKEGTRSKKVMVPTRIVRGRKNISLSQGNHNLIANGKSLKSFHLDGAYLAHIPIRGPGQYAAKVAVKYLQYRSMAKKENTWGWHYKTPYELMKSDPRTFLDTYRDAALRFAVRPERGFEPEAILDPIPYGGSTLRYTATADDKWRPLRLILKYAEELALGYCDLSLRHDRALDEVRRPRSIMKALTSLFSFRGW